MTMETSESAAVPVLSSRRFVRETEFVSDCMVSLPRALEESPCLTEGARSV